MANHDITCKMDTSITVCDCCGKEDLSRTVLFEGSEIESGINLGVICTQNNFGVQMRGAPIRAIKHLQSKLNEMTANDILSILDGAING